MTPPDALAPRRRPPEGGYARGEETRARIVQAALEVFAAEGFAQASTRRIAAEAGVNPPALQYYFDSKAGLHRACGDFIIGEVGRALAPALAQARAAAATGDPSEAVEALCALLDALADLSLEAEETPGWSRFMARAQADDEGPAYAHVKGALSSPMHALACRLVGAALGRGAGEEEVRLRALLALAQLSPFHHNRKYALAALDWEGIGPARLALLKAVVRDQTRAALLPTGRRPPAPD